METRFENSFVRDENTAKEIYRYWFFRKPTMVALYVILAFYTLACIFGLSFDFEDAKDFIFPFFTAILIPVLMIISYRSQVKTMVNRDREMAKGSELVTRVCVNDNEFTVFSLDSHTSILVSDLKYAFLTKSYIAVITKARLMVILKKDSFTIGDTESFLAFLREKNIKIKGQKK